MVFSSNFFEHLPTKDALLATFRQARLCLKPGGRLICVGPNLRFLPDIYWDFWDHYLGLSDRTMVEGLTLAGFDVISNTPRFIPYSMSTGFTPPVVMLEYYLKMPIFWPLFGKQFLIVARRPN